MTPPREAAWPDQMFASQQVRRRLRNASAAQRPLTGSEARELDRLVRQDRPMPGDGSIALALLKAMFDRRADQAYLRALGQHMRLFVIEPASALNTDQTVAPDILAVEGLGGVGEPVDVICEVTEFGADLLKGEPANEGRAVAGNAGDAEADAKGRIGTAFHIDDSALADPVATPCIAIASNDLNAGATPLGKAPAERTLGCGKAHSNLSGIKITRDEAESALEQNDGGEA